METRTKSKPGRPPNPMYAMRRLRVPKNENVETFQVGIQGKVYTADKDGIIRVPRKLIPLFTQRFGCEVVY